MMVAARLRAELAASRLLKKVFGRPRCATLIQSPIPGRKKDSSLRDFGFENCVSSADFRVFQQPARDECSHAKWRGRFRQQRTNRSNQGKVFLVLDGYIASSAEEEYLMSPNSV
jgi:hypothetical protein